MAAGQSRVRTFVQGGDREEGLLGGETSRADHSGGRRRFAAVSETGRRKRSQLRAVIDDGHNDGEA